MEGTPNTKRTNRAVVLTGGVTDDNPVTEQMLREMENLIADYGKTRPGLAPRGGLTLADDSGGTPLAFTTALTSGCRVFKVHDSEDTDRSIFVIYRVSTGTIVGLFEHRDQRGRVRPTADSGTYTP